MKCVTSASPSVSTGFRNIGIAADDCSSSAIVTGEATTGGSATRNTPTVTDTASDSAAPSSTRTSTVRASAPGDSDVLLNDNDSSTVAYDADDARPDNVSVRPAASYA